MKFKQQMKRTQQMKKMIIATTLTCISMSAMAGSVEDNIKHKMRNVLANPNAVINSVKPVQGFNNGLYEVVIDKSHIIYSNKDASKLVKGDVLNIKTKINETQNKIQNLRRVDYSNLPFKDSITITKGNGMREFTVFTDPKCPYCRILEEQLDKVTNYKMHVFFFPLAFHKGSKKLAEEISCAKNPSKAFNNWMHKGLEPKTKNLKCNGKQFVQRNIELGQSLGINGTPAIIWKDGRVTPGAVSANKIEQRLNQTNLFKATSLKKDAK